MKPLVLFLFCLFSKLAFSQTIKIASGEYAPFSGEYISNQGISTMIVKAVFKEIKDNISLEFMPWNRVMLQTENGVVAGSFPWIQNKERLEKNYFSKPINNYRIVAFYKKGFEYKIPSSLQGKIICIPIGWDVSLYQSFISKMEMHISSPAKLESCFNMLAKNRVDIVLINELVGHTINHELFGQASPLVAREQSLIKQAENLHFIVSKKYPNGKKLIENFNRGLEKIKANGVYDSIVSAKSTFSTYNQLGSL